MFVEQYIWFGIQGLKADLCLLPQSNPKGTAIFAELLVKFNTTPDRLHFDDYCYRRELVGSKDWLHRTTGNTNRNKELTGTWAIEYDNARYTSIINGLHYIHPDPAEGGAEPHDDPWMNFGLGMECAQ